MVRDRWWDLIEPDELDDDADDEDEDNDDCIDGILCGKSEKLSIRT